MDCVEIVSVDLTAPSNGQTALKVTLKRGDDLVTADGVVDWEDDYADDETFDLWVEAAAEEEEGFAAILVDGDRTIMLGKM